MSTGLAVPYRLVILLGFPLQDLGLHRAKIGWSFLYLRFNKIYLSIDDNKEDKSEFNPHDVVVLVVLGSNFILVLRVMKI